MLNTTDSREGQMQGFGKCGGSRLMSGAKM